MTLYDRVLPGPLERAPNVTVTPGVVTQFRQNRQVEDQPKTGALLGTWSPGGHLIQIAETVPWAGPVERETAPVHPFAVNLSYLEGCLEILNLHDQAIHLRLRGPQPRQPITMLGHWLVMPEMPLAVGEDSVDAMRQASGRELALLERALGAGWLAGTQLITAVREEWGRTRVRAYVVRPGLPVRKVPFPEELLGPRVFPPFRLPAQDGPAAVQGENE